MQKNVLTTEQVKEIIDNLYHTIGVRMNVNLSKHPNLSSSLGVNQSSFQDDCKMITNHMELPIQIRPSFTSSFKTKGLVHNEGNSMSGIGAQIHIPSNLPYYKTAAMEDFPISVTVPPEAFAQGHYYLLTQLSHEFSHIYLHSRRDPQKDSEWATDLCALMMGFTPLWLQGRKHTEKQENSKQITVYTRTQGYLSDDEFDFAVNYIDNLRTPFEQLRNSLSLLKQQIQSVCNDVSRYLKDVYLLLDFHFKHPQKSFKHIQDAAVFSNLMQSQYKLEVETLLADSKRDTNDIILPLKNKREFYEADKKWMGSKLEELKIIEEKLCQKLNGLKRDYEVVIQNIDVEYYTKIFNTRIETISEGVRKANRKIHLVSHKIDTLEECLAYYKTYKKKAIANKEDARILSLICGAEFISKSRTLVKKSQGKVEGIEGVLKESYSFYCIDDEVLLSHIAELNDLISTMDYCLEEQKNHIKIVQRNLSFIGRAKWIINSVFTVRSDNHKNYIYGTE
ncbi:MAG: hypothetical protein J6I36_07250 [Bacteroidaceae bacterium]|nr:hypothetical protein [Bacteroidaceae bacterium]